MRRLAVLLMLGSEPAIAAPDCAPYGEPRFVVAAPKVTACFPDNGRETCFELSPRGKPRRVGRVAVQKSAPRSPAALRIVNKQLSACVGKSCTPLGKALAAKVAKVAAEAEADGPNGMLLAVADAVLVSGDGKAVVLEQGGTRSVWSVAGDRELPLKPPPAGGGLLSVEVASGAMIATWADCAGPCGTSIFVDSAGTNLGTWFPAGRAIGLGTRVAIIPTDDGATFRLFDLAGRQLVDSTVVVPDTIGGPHATRVDNSTLLVAGRGSDPKSDADVWELRFITVAPGASPVAGPTQRIPRCKN